MSEPASRGTSIPSDGVVASARIAGDTVLGGTFFTARGGKGANQAVAAARAGGSVTLVACVGDDTFGNPAPRPARDAGVCGVCFAPRSAQYPFAIL